MVYLHKKKLIFEFLTFGSKSFQYDLFNYSELIFLQLLLI